LLFLLNDLSTFTCQLILRALSGKTSEFIGCAANWDCESNARVSETVGFTLRLRVIPAKTL